MVSMSLATPWSGDLEEGVYEIVFSEVFMAGGVDYGFVMWENGSTDPVRNVDLRSGLTVSCEYAAPVMPYIPPFSTPVEERERIVVLESGGDGMPAVQLASVSLLAFGGEGYVDSVRVKAVHNKRGGYDLKAADLNVHMAVGVDGPRYHFTLAGGESVEVRLIHDKKGGYGFQAV